MPISRNVCSRLDLYCFLCFDARKGCRLPWLARMYDSGDLHVPLPRCVLSFLRHILKGPKAAPFYSSSETRARKNAWRAIFSYFFFIFFYSSTSSLSESDYVQHVFSLVPALLALAGSLMVLFFRLPSCRTKRGWYRFKLSMQLCLIIS